MAQNDKPIADRNENCKSVEDCGGASVSSKEKRQDYETRKDVTNSLDPQQYVRTCYCACTPGTKYVLSQYAGKQQLSTAYRHFENGSTIHARETGSTP